jgi:anaerobic selenocysteine-containing dehydrogenase
MDISRRAFIKAQAAAAAAAAANVSLPTSAQNLPAGELRFEGFDFSRQLDGAE